MTKREVIENLELHPLEIEGGFFREVYRSRTPVEITAPDGEKNAYAASTSIYYLLGCGDVSSMHSVKFDETWHFYASSDTGIFVDLIVVSPAGTGRRVKLGARLELGAGSAVHSARRALDGGENRFGGRSRTFGK